ncbi:metal binding domain of Ada-domain-containing protein [Ilyonectria robusta]|uniref:metal binding domain of Ada-domain-containing protein n=1 Tax=Ilyonectria robusta TaxID=1079257 RepID=UPI001E8DB912|nr:metal binding domain of Ada-domain-containing protein [Ilyonectria robusta]KAH8734571.1 metal binding domain of Ada-domain-containing protein [Ilyonectria robusta]
MDANTLNLESPFPFISLFDDDESRWQAVVSRNANADGLFVYGVRTTKIFCRPICKARLARRANVSFYLSGRDAQQSGFRACKRCKPELAGFMPEEMAVQKIRGFVGQRISNGGDDGEAMLSLSQMAKQTGLSKWHFHRVFKKCVGMTPTEYIRDERLRHSTAEGQLSDNQASWLESLDIENFNAGLDFSCWDDVIGSAQSSTEASSAAASEYSPWNLDDLVIWPEERNQGSA